MSGRSGAALRFLRADVDESAKLSELSLKGLMSVALTSRYEFYGLSLLEEDYVVASPVGPFTVDRLAADFSAIEAKTSKPVIALVSQLSPYFRKALIARRIPFLLEDKQAYLPFIYLNVIASTSIHQPRDFAPATQAVFLALLYSEGVPQSQESLERQLLLSPMSVSRAVGQLASHELIDVETTGKTGRRKVITVPDAAVFYRLGMEHFGEAVKRSIHIAGKPPQGLLRSGIDALSRRTMLGPPECPSFAASKRHYQELESQQIDWREAADRRDSFKVDLLGYDPSTLTSDDLVDPVTMVLTVDHHDERIDEAIDTYMREFAWYSE
ncbi:MAG: MarR family transcriptional regulator [Propionibacteriaceae bacterium]|jgi:hypothetical protein|nr:MarR family transcriptional regulator [Propionibacteriaceae bacterium]